MLVYTIVLILLNVQHQESFSKTCVVLIHKLVLYKVKDLCGINSRTCAVSSHRLVLYQVKDLCGIK